MNQYDKKKLLNYIDTVSFALIDTTLYLDTHPNDQKAINHFNQYQKARKQALKELPAFGSTRSLLSAKTEDILGNNRYSVLRDLSIVMRKSGDNV